MTLPTHRRPTARPPGITLAMIVRDESSVIERCLESVRPLLSHWVIVDTGSTDDTVDRIERALEGIPGRLHRRPWIDFGHNRSELMELARGTGSHLLLVDADMTIRVERPLTAADLEAADALQLRHDGDPVYWIPRLVRSDLDWRYEGATHEYLTLDGPFSTASCDAIVIEHHGDGGRRWEKFDRDRRLLEAAVAADPNDARSRFYLAQTLRDLGETAEAIEQYHARVALGGWAEEVFYSRLQIGELLAATDWDAAVVALLEAWDTRPTRAEPLLTLARGWRVRGRYNLAYRFACIGSEIARPADSLFVHPEAYDWGLLFERSISAFHVGEVDDSRRSSEALLDGRAPAHLEPWILHNLAWCDAADGRSDATHNARLPLHGVTALPSLAEVVPSTRLHELTPDVRPGWSRFNPSVVRRPGGGFLVNVRSANYRLEGGVYLDVDGEPIDVVHTENHLVTLDEDLQVVATTSVPTVPSSPGVDSDVRGCEDLRLVLDDGRLTALGTSRDRDPNWLCTMVRLEIDTIGEPPRVLAVTTTPITGPTPGRHEKNWMPFVVDGELLALYSVDPTVVVRVGADGSTEVVTRVEGPPGTAGFRGGSQGVDTGRGWLFVVHEVVDRPIGRLYSHRLVLLEAIDGRWTITATSAPFHFVEPGVEFCAGLARHGDRVLLTFGVMDRTAWIAECRLDELLDVLVPVRPDTAPNR